VKGPWGEPNAVALNGSEIRYGRSSPSCCWPRCCSGR